jgi:hypothetical protein
MKSHGRHFTGNLVGKASKLGYHRLDQHKRCRRQVNGSSASEHDLQSYPESDAPSTVVYIVEVYVALEKLSVLHVDRLPNLHNNISWSNDPIINNPGNYNIRAHLLRRIILHGLMQLFDPIANTERHLSTSCARRWSIFA